MIREFLELCKYNFKNISEIELFNESYASIRIELLACPHCGSTHSCTYHASYKRNLISYENGSVLCNNILVKRAICSSCNRTHAILPDFLIPYGSYSLLFVLRVLKEYFLHMGGGLTVSHLSEKYQIAESTLYKWIHLFRAHKSVWLSVLTSNDLSLLDFLNHIFAVSAFTRNFFLKLGFSFMQLRNFNAKSHPN